MVQLKTTQAFRFGQKNIIPFAGEVQISEEGIIEIESFEVAQEIVKSNCGFSFVEEEENSTLQPKVEQNDLSSSEDQNDFNNQEEKDDLENNNNDASISAAEVSAKDLLEEKTKAELQEMVEAYPASEWRALNKADLIDYILEKAKDA